MNPDSHFIPIDVVAREPLATSIRKRRGCRLRGWIHPTGHGDQVLLFSRCWNSVDHRPGHRGRMIDNRSIVPNWPESRASNEDEFVLRRGLIVRSQWSTVWTCHEVPHLRRASRHPGKRREKKIRETESALTNRDLTPCRCFQLAFDL